MTASPGATPIPRSAGRVVAFGLILLASLRTATPHAEDVARSLVDDVQLPEARVKATSILQRLRLRD